MTDNSTDVKGSGWVSFSVVMFLLSACLNIIAGIAGFAAKDRFAEDAMLWKNVRGVAIFFLVMGALHLVSGLLVYQRRGVGRILGVFVALTTTCMWFFALDARPYWALIMIGLNVMIMYALTTSGAAFKGGLTADFDESSTNVPHGM
jgi:hypothetical protein